MKDMKSRTSCKIVNNLIAQIEDREKGQKWTREEIARLLRDSMAVRSLKTNIDRDLLLRELQLIEEAIAPIKA